MANQDRQVLLDTIHEMDIELRQAARAGLLLLEKNEDLEAQVDRARFQQREASMEADTLREQRKTAVLEVNAALTRIKELEEQLRHDRAAHQAVQDSFLGKIDALQSELRKAYKKTTQTLPEKTKEEFKNDEDDPRLALLQLDKTRLKRQLQDALKKLRRLDIESTRAATTTNEHIVALERAMLQLTMEKKTMEEEQMEERALIRDLQQINREYQKVVDAQAIQDLDQGVVSLHDDIMHTNAMLQLRVNQLQEDAIQLEGAIDATEDEETHWTMEYPLLRGFLDGIHFVWHAMVSCTDSWLASWTSDSSLDNNVSPDNAIDTCHAPREKNPVDVFDVDVVQDNVSDVQPSSVGQPVSRYGLMVGIYNVWLVWLAVMSCALSWLRGETTHAVVVPILDNRVKSRLPVVSQGDANPTEQQQSLDDGDVVRLAWCTLYLVLYLYF
ncbi:hypothetical protein Ae201684_001601 [Aphanomyces euteiches]|uniref:Uncharacterized protein n=1 Tax=Aphanomyces euteiches TaxID=100861 RepID=A0A6G0XU48_9STRA|nr:hypothetical protein Ae201684_001601 [Aphanomyces euteiches]